jgi:TIR domain
MTLGGQKNRRTKRESPRPKSNTPVKAAAATGPVRVFISYAHEDVAIAEVVRTEIKSIDRRVECFLDLEEIEPGVRFEEKLIKALGAADWLMGLYTGKQSQYCGFEVGVFTTDKALSATPGDSRVVCLFDVEPVPGVFQFHQNVKVITPPPPTTDPISAAEVEFYKKSPVFRFLSSFCRYKNLYIMDNMEGNARLESELIKRARNITKAFENGRGKDEVVNTPTQLGWEVLVTADLRSGAESIPDTAAVTGTYESFRLFGLMPDMLNRQLPLTNWGNVKQTYAKSYGDNVIWIEVLEREMLRAARELALENSESYFSSREGKIYRAVLVRHIRYRNGTHLFAIVFVESMPRKFLGDQSAPLILAGIVLASRLRFAYFEHPDQANLRFSDEQADRDFEIACRQLCYDLERIRHEAMELGLLDIPAFVRAFGEENKAVAESFIETSRKAREELFSKLPGPHVSINAQSRPIVKEAILKWLKEVAEENKRFLLTAVDVYKKKLLEQLGKLTELEGNR